MKSVFPLAIALMPALASYAALASAPAKITAAAHGGIGKKGVESGDLNRTIDACHAARSAVTARERGPASGSEVPGARSTFQFTGIPAGIFHGERSGEALRGLVARQFDELARNQAWL